MKVIGRCTSRNGPTPTSQISSAATKAMATLVAIVLAHGCQPLRINPDGQSLPQDEVVRGTDAEHHQRIAVKPIL